MEVEYSEFRSIVLFGLLYCLQSINSGGRISRRELDDSKRNDD